VERLIIRSTQTIIWKHARDPVYFSLVVDDFLIKYETTQQAKHLIQALEQVHYAEKRVKVTSNLGSY
jgi:hypothetical protein